jgi:hypothetical protein
MKLTLWLVPMVCIYLLLISATSVKVQPASVSADNKAIMEAPLSANTFRTSKLNFFQRTLLKLALKKSGKADLDKADSQANTALAFGIGACVLLVAGLFIPYVIFASLPAAIVAMITGGSALRNNTNFEGKARTGKALGLGALIASGVVMIVAAIMIAAFLRSWG